MHHMLCSLISNQCFMHPWCPAAEQKVDSNSSPSVQAQHVAVQVGYVFALA